MRRTPTAGRLQIGILGRRNSGKSSLLNAITRQQISVVSGTPGTTTDPVAKAMELLPLGPVTFYDTAGLDDYGELGEKRVTKTRKIIERLEIAIIVSTGDTWGDFEIELLSELELRKIPVIVVFNKNDLVKPSFETLDSLKDKKIETVQTTCRTSDMPMGDQVNEGVEALRAALIRTVPSWFLENKTIIGDLVPENSLVVLVTPIDKEAPRGRLIMPQVQTIRDALDNGIVSLVLTEDKLIYGLSQLKQPPALVVTDSQVFSQVNKDTPEDILLTSFSILFARIKGELSDFVRGALAIPKLKAGDKVLIAEACTHHPIEDDISTVKIPNWIKKYVGADLHFTQAQGHDYFENPEDLKQFSLVVHCGACTFNRRQVLWRIHQCRLAGVPITNYGLTIAFTNNMFDRVLMPFKDVYEMYKEMKVR